MSYNTGNPVPSKDPRDLVDNAENLDRALNGESVTFDDRLGKQRKSWAGIEQDFADFLASSGFEPVHLVYQDGVALTVDRPTQLIDYESSVYRVKMPSDFPVHLSGNWATDSALLVDVGDQSLRQELASPSGAAMVGRGAMTVGSIADLVALPEGLRKADLSYIVAGYYPGAYALANPQSAGGGTFIWDASRPKSDHNGGTIISPSVPFDGTTTGLPDFLAGIGESDPDGIGCFVRQFSGRIHATWFGGYNSTAINAAVSFAYTTPRNRTVYLESGDIWSITSPILIPYPDLHLVGDGQMATTLAIKSEIPYLLDIGDGTTFIDNVTVRHMTLDGEFRSGLLALIRSRRCQKTFTIEDVEFYRAIAGAIGLQTTECWGLNLRECHFYFVGRGADISGANCGIISGNYFWNNSRENLVLSNASNLSVFGNAFETYSLASEALYYNVYIMDNVFSSKVFGNWFETQKASSSHLMVDGSCARVEVEHNTFFGHNLANHMVIMNAPASSVSYNRMSMSNPSRNHIRLGVGATRTRVEDNEYTGTSPQLQDLTGGQFFPSQSIVLKGSAAFDPASLAPGDAVETSVSVPGAKTGNYVAVSFSSNVLSVNVFGWVEQNDVVKVRFENHTTIARDIPSGFIRVAVTEH